MALRGRYRLEKMRNEPAIRAEVEGGLLRWLLRLNLLLVEVGGLGRGAKGDAPSATNTLCQERRKEMSAYRLFVPILRVKQF